jgi:hypothetical protein
MVSFEQVFPTRLGIHLSNRMREDVFQDVMKKIGEAYSIDTDRLHAKVAELSDALKNTNAVSLYPDRGFPRSAGRWARI